VGQVHQYLQALGYDVMRAFPINIYQEAHPARIMFMGGIIKTVGL
jgi:hypothetical protein